MIDQREYNRRLIEEFRATRSVSGQLEGRPLLLLTTTGAKSGQLRTTPLMYVAHDDQLIIIASNMGAQTHPDWYRNLVAQPQVSVEVGSETFEATAVVLEGEARVRQWEWIIERYPFFVEHQAKTSREIPLVALERR